MKTTHFLFLILMALGLEGLSQVPILNSNPSITGKVIYLDFDGHKAVATLWNNGNTVNALPSTANSNNITTIFRRMSEDYRPFDVNITTDSNRFNNAPANRRIRVVFTPSNAWYGNSAGGVAYVSSFSWGGTPGTPCWVFEAMLGNNTKSMAEAASHEVGHTLSLRHQSIYDAACNKTAEYHPGLGGTGVTSWAPIMGVGYNRNVTTWHTGKSATSCTTIQFDHGNGTIGITGIPFLSFLPDDIGNAYATAKILNLNTLNTVDSGLITEPSDIDAFRFTICGNRNVSFNIKPWALDTNNYAGANLDIRFMLYDASNNLLTVDTPLTKLFALKSINLTAGSYYFTVDGGGSANYSDYGSLGKYFVRIKATNPPALANNIVVDPNLCIGQPLTFSYTSNGTPSTWSWSVTAGSSTVLTTQYPSYTFNSAGVYTLSLLATSPTSLSCPTTMTLNVGTPPNLAATITTTFLCAGESAVISASGASNYSWMPGSYTGSVQTVSPNTTTTYTITGSNGSCNASVVKTVSVAPSFNLNVSVSKTQACYGETVSITSSGVGASFTLSPGNITNNPAVVTPLANITYTVTASNGTCTKTQAVSVSVSPDFTVNTSVTANTICVGDNVILNSSGANTFTVYPGGITGAMVSLMPNSSTSYTVVGKNGSCLKASAPVDITVENCDMTGIREQNGAKALHIYPNPASASITIEGLTSGNQVEILNSLGQVVYVKSAAHNSMTINSTSWSKGVYFARILSSGQKIQVEKIIVE